MCSYKDENIEERILKLKNEIVKKRDESPASSEKRKYYRKLSKYFDNIVVNSINFKK